MKEHREWRKRDFSLIVKRPKPFCSVCRAYVDAAVRWYDGEYTHDFCAACLAFGSNRLRRTTPAPAEPSRRAQGEG